MRGRKAAGVESGSSREETSFASVPQGVAAFPIFGFGGNDFQAHLPAQRARDEAPHRMRLPFGDLHDLVQVAPPDRFSKSRMVCVLLP